MAVQSIGSKIEEILGDEAASLLQYQCKTIPKETLHLPGPDYVERIYSISDRPTRVLTTPSVAARSRTARRYRLRVDSPGRPGHRALGGRIVCAEPDVLRSREHREAGDRRRLQRRRVNAWRARIGRAEIRAQDSVPVEAEPQRVSLVSERVRSDQVRGPSRRRSRWARRAWARRSTSARKSRSGRLWK